MLVGDAVEQRIDKRDLLAIHLGWDISQTHLPAQKRAMTCPPRQKDIDSRKPQTATRSLHKGRLPCQAMTKKIL
jgi:hypothetical protein